MAALEDDVEGVGRPIFHRHCVHGACEQTAQVDALATGEARGDICTQPRRPEVPELQPEVTRLYLDLQIEALERLVAESRAQYFLAAQIEVVEVVQ